jgi:uncharacterized protein YuzE
MGGGSRRWSRLQPDASAQCPLLISLREGKLADSIDLKEGVILHLDDKGLPLEIEILDAAKPARPRRATRSHRPDPEHDTLHNVQPDDACGYRRVCL